MAKIAELTNDSQMRSTLNSGLKVVSDDEIISFQKYNRYVLPLDGYVFWVKDTASTPISVQGSLHYSTDQLQREDETIGLNRVLFTTQNQIQDFNSIANGVMYIGQIDEIRFAFTSRSNVYQNAGTFHYRGDAIYPVMYSQIIDNPSNPINLGGLIATNSMPIWLGLTQYMQLFPSFLLPSNELAPYGAIDISETRPLQSAPSIDATSSQTQLMAEKVKITMYGLRNDQALDFQSYIMNYSLVYDNIGIMNMPAIIDAKRGQSELGILAQKKEIEFEISYYQSRSNSIARQLILSAPINITLN